MCCCSRIPFPARGSGDFALCKSLTSALRAEKTPIVTRAELGFDGFVARPRADYVPGDAGCSNVFQKVAAIAGEVICKTRFEVAG
jgi:hypothetical protein